MNVNVFKALLVCLPLLGNFCKANRTMNMKSRTGVAFLNYPVILVPGEFASGLEMKLDNAKGVDTIACKVSTNGIYKLLWPSMNFNPPDCITSYMSLKYENGSTKSLDGVTIRPANALKNLEWIDPTGQFQIFGRPYYYRTMAKYLRKYSHRDEVNLTGLPYDWRKTPGDMKELFTNTKKTIERLYAENSNTPVVLITHSMGSIIIYHFLKQQSQAWKDRFINMFVAIAAPWAGNTRALKMLLHGDNYGFYMVTDKEIQPVERSMPSTTMLLPSDINKIWTIKTIFVRTPYRVYDAQSMGKFFKDFGLHREGEIYKNTRKFMNFSTPPNVPVHCVYGTGINTISNAEYSNMKTFPDSPKFRYTKRGDGVVHLINKKMCLKWERLQSKMVAIDVFDKVDHYDLIRDKRVLENTHLYVQLAKIYEPYSSNLEDEIAKSAMQSWANKQYNLFQIFLNYILLGSAMFLFP